MNKISAAEALTNVTRRRPNQKAAPKVSVAEVIEGVFVSENKLQNEVVKRLRALEDAEGFRVVHVPNGGKRSKRSGSQFKNRGLRKGFPDLMIIAGTDIIRATPIIFIELKQPKGSLSDEQVEWHTWLGDMMYPVYVCTTVASVCACLRSHGLRV